MTKPSANLFDQPLSGAYSSLESMINARFSAKDLKLRQRRKALSLLAGPNKTRFRGRGLDFEEVRAYQAGDDIRSIDWRVTARSGKAYTKTIQRRARAPDAACDRSTPRDVFLAANIASNPYQPVISAPFSLGPAFSKGIVLEA